VDYLSFPFFGVNRDPALTLSLSSLVWVILAHSEDCGGGRKLWVTRKGATSAKLGEMGIIPGSMGTGSYITRGRGNLMSWNSSSHGAGRRMSRTKAKMIIPQKDFEDSMKGIVCDTDPGVKDEAPQAYKDLTVVMKNQESLTDIVHHLLPLINVKGIESKNPPKNPSEEELESLQKKLRTKLEKKEEKILGRLNTMSEQLQSKDFINKAPDYIVNMTRGRLLDLEEQVAELQSRLAQMEK